MANIFGAVGKIVKKNLKGAIKIAAGAVGGAFGGPAGAALLTAGVSTALASKGPGTAMTVFAPQQPVYNPPGIDIGGFNINLPGFGAPGMGITQSSYGKRGRVARGSNGECPRGYHLNKSATGDGQPARAFCVRNRHVNYANGRAAARSGRRLRGTVKMLKRSFTLVSAKPAKGKWIPKGRKKS